MTKRTSVKSGVMNFLLSDDSEVISRKSTSSSASNAAFVDNDRMLSAIGASIPASPINGYASLVNFAPSSAKPVHRWFWYREGYSQELVDEFVQGLPRGSVVLDPFCGAGTSLISAQRANLPSIGFDVNPISILVSRVKITGLSEKLRVELDAAIESLKKAKATSPQDEKPALKIIDKVYDAKILKSLLIFRKLIKLEKSQKVRDFLFVAWLSILEKVSNVYKEGNGVKYKNRKRTDSGYVEVDLKAWQDASFPKDRFAYVRETLLDQIHMMVADLDLIPRTSPLSRIVEDSATSLEAHIQPNTVSLAIFSPPYCNCFNYFKMYKLELWMGEFVQSYDEMKKLNRRGLRSHVETVLKKSGDAAEEISEDFAALLDGVDLWDKRIPDAIRGYFIDMKDTLAGLHAVLKPSARCVIVIGNSAYGGIVIPTDAILAKIGQNIGFAVEKLAVARPLTTSSQQRQHLVGRSEYLRESILILTKKDPRLEDKDLEVVDEIPADDGLRADKVFVIKNSLLTEGTHKFHRYPGKFIPHVPRWALARYGKKSSIVIDPFCGSGTTLVEAAKLGMRGFGVDIDPIARLVSSVKTTYIAQSEIASLVKDVKARLGRQTKPKFLPDLPTLGHWFNDDAIAKLGRIRDVIEKYRDAPKQYRFLLVCFAAIVRRASNADNQTQKTYVSHTRLKVPEDSEALFLKTLDDYSSRVVTLPICDTSVILDGCSALTFADRWQELKLPGVDMIVTSPPYLNSVDYVYNQMAEYFWIGDLFEMHNQPLQNAHKRNYVGTSAIGRHAYQETFSVGIQSIDDVVARVALKSQKNAFIVAKYFRDMAIHFRQARRVLKSSGTYTLVIGDSLVSGEPIDVSRLLEQTALSEGLKTRQRFGYEIRNRHMRFPRMGRGGLLRYDWVLEMEREQ